MMGDANVSKLYLVMGNVKLFNSLLICLFNLFYMASMVVFRFTEHTPFTLYTG